MSEKPRVLIADDEQNIRRVLSAMLRRAGYRPKSVEDGQLALEALSGDGPFAVLVTDLRMPRLSGMDLLREVVDKYPEVPVIMITAHGSVNSAVEAVKIGAFDYIEKPFDNEQIRQVVEKAVAHHEIAARSARPVDNSTLGKFGMIGTGVAMQEIFEIIERVGDSPSTVMITGESGTGKELVAKALHMQSSRKKRPFIKVNCAAIPDTLIESELFGHEKGAFTGAVSSKPGRFELADEGTLLLDEIGEIPGPMQVKLLRALQESEFERVGGVKTLKVDVRLIAATNKDLAEETKQGNFREDLYYRLNVVPVKIPPLRERPEDVPLLVNHFLEHFNEKLGKEVDSISAEALDRLIAYPWPGNIRELENLLERTLLFCDHAVIQVADLPEEMQTEKLRARAGASARAVADSDAAQLAADLQAEATQAVGGSLKQAVKAQTERVERHMIVRALEETGGNVTRAAKLLQISRKSLQIKMKELGLRREEGGAPRGSESPSEGASSESGGGGESD